MPHVRLRLREADGRLPPVCLCCGAPATATEARDLPKLSSTVWLVLFVAGPFLFRAASALASKSVRLQAPLCDRHRNHWTRGTRLIWTSFAVFGGIIAAAFLLAHLLPEDLQAALSPFIGVAGYLLFLAWLGILCVARDSEIRLIDIDRKELLLGGVSNEFIRAIDAMDREAIARARKRRASTPGDDAFESSKKQESNPDAAES